MRGLLAAASLGLIWAIPVSAEAVQGSANAVQVNSSALARAVENKLRPPDASGAVAQPLDGTLVPGVSTSPESIGPNSGVKSSPVAPRAYGSFGIPYTTTRVAINPIKSKGPLYLSSTYPYRAIGVLLFSTSRGTAICTASLIARGIVVTAAHCVMEFGSNTPYSQHQFNPGLITPAVGSSKVVRPYGAWAASGVAWPPSWANGTDTGDDAARNNDLAVIAIAPDRRGRFVGDFTGWLGYGWNNYSFVSSPKTGDLATAAVTTIGYPCRMDFCGVMQRTDGPAYITTVGSALQYWQGSNFTGGSSGGPWIVNFKSQDAVLSGGAVQGTEPGMAIIGVTSWGSEDPNAIKDNYSSRFGQTAEFPQTSYGIYGAGNIGWLMFTICNRIPPGETRTYEQLGYCTLG